MGFWDSLVEGAKSAGGWALDHAGDIAGAVNTVAKIAGTFSVLEDTSEPDNQTHLADFHTNFKIASHKLQQRAKQIVATMGPEADRRLNTDEFDDDDAVLDSVTGIWTDPAPLTKDGLPTISMYQDLSKWLATLGVPSSSKFDVAAGAAEALFVGTNQPTSRTKSEDLIQSTQFTADGPAGWKLDIAHAYYALPLGASAGDKSWHSCIYGKFLPSSSYIAEKRQRVHATAIAMSVTPGVPIWMINATINWGKTLEASKVYKNFLQNLKTTFGASSGRSIVSSNLTGVSQFIQVRGNKDDNPSIIQQLLSNSAATSLSEQVTNPDNNGNDGENHNNGVADGTDGFDNNDLALPVKKRTLNGGANKNRVTNFSTATSDMPTVVPKVTVTKSQLIFPSTEGN